MVYVTIDKAGKLYLPVSVRKEVAGRKYTVLVLPTGEIELHPVRKFESPVRALQQLGRIRKSIRSVRKEILKEALRRF